MYEQYDHMVRSDTVVRPGGDAGVVRIKGMDLGIAMTLDGNGRYTARDPRRGGALAVAEACRNLAAVGATPVGATNCLNFGNPERPEIMWEFTEAIAGMTEALEALGVPITGGNVSFYNETEGANIFPTPVVGVVGVLDDATRRIPQHFAAAGDLLFLAGPESGDALGASAFLKERHGRTDGRPPEPDLDAEVRLGAFLRAAGAAGLAASARDLSEGGLAAAAIESLFAPDGSAIGAELQIGCAGRLEGPLFGEGPARALLAVRPGGAEALAGLASREGVPLTAVGSVGGDALRIRVNGSPTVSLASAASRTSSGTVWGEWLWRRMRG